MGATDTERDMAEQLREAAATVSTTTKLLRWGGVTFALFAGGWAVRQDTRTNALEIGQATLIAERRTVVEEYRLYQGRQEAQIAKLISTVETMISRLARVETQIEGLRKQ